MKITEIIKGQRPSLSFEVFPPKTESNFESVKSATEEIAQLRPAFMSVTYGAGGGTSRYTLDIAKNIKDSQVIMADISEKALEIAKNNAKDNEVIDKCSCVLSDMFENIQEKFDVIVSNPPYIKTEVIKTLDKEVQNEPHLALDGGEDGLHFYKLIAKNAYKYLNKDGILALEIGYDQKGEVTELLEIEGKYTDIYCKKDLSGNDRIIVCKLK